MPRDLDELLATMREQDEHTRARTERLAHAVRAAADHLALIGHTRDLETIRQIAFTGLVEINNIIREP